MGIFDFVSIVFNSFFGDGGKNEQDPEPKPEKSLWESPLFIVVLIFGFITVIALLFRK